MTLVIPGNHDIDTGNLAVAYDGDTVLGGGELA